MGPRRWSFLIPILLFSAACGLVLWVVLYAINLPFLPLHGVMVVWFALLTAGLHTWQEHGLATDPKGFVRRFMGGLMLKMLLSLVLLVVLVLRLPGEQVANVGISFAVLYIAFLVFSTTRLMRMVRTAPKP